MKITYTCFWNKEREKTWSGTTYFLYKALHSKITLNNFEVKISILEKILIKITSIKIQNKKVFIDDKFNKLKFFLCEKKVNNYFNKKNDISFQIGDFAACKNPTYVYQDLSIDSLIYYKENKPELYKYSSF